MRHQTYGTDLVAFVVLPRRPLRRKIGYRCHRSPQRGALRRDQLLTPRCCIVVLVVLVVAALHSEPGQETVYLRILEHRVPGVPIDAPEHREHLAYVAQVPARRRQLHDAQMARARVLVLDAAAYAAACLTQRVASNTSDASSPLHVWAEDRIVHPESAPFSAAGGVVLGPPFLVQSRDDPS